MYASLPIPHRFSPVIFFFALILSALILVLICSTSACALSTLILLPYLRMVIHFSPIHIIIFFFLSPSLSSYLSASLSSYYHRRYRHISIIIIFVLSSLSFNHIIKIVLSFGFHPSSSSSYFPSSYHQHYHYSSSSFLSLLDPLLTLLNSELKFMQGKVVGVRWDVGGWWTNVPYSYFYLFNIPFRIPEPLVQVRIHHRRLCWTHWSCRGVQHPLLPFPWPSNLIWLFCHHTLSQCVLIPALRLGLVFTSQNI